MTLGRRDLLRLGVAAAAASLAPGRAAAATVAPLDPRERRLGSLRRLTSGGQNAEAYWDAAGTRLIFQSTRPPFDCDQMFTMNADGSGQRLLSSGSGRTTCGFFFPDGRRVIYASTHAAGAACKRASRERSAISRASAVARAGKESGATSSASTSCRSASAGPPVAGATTARPAARASRTTRE